MIFSPYDYDKHKERVGHVLDKLITHGVKINPQKSVWIRDEVQYLGLVFNASGSKPAPALVEKIQQFPPPRDLKALKTVLGMFSFYRTFINNYSNIAKPLLTMLKSDEPFKWTNECTQAFDT